MVACDICHRIVAALRHVRRLSPKAQRLVIDIHASVGSGLAIEIDDFATHHTPDPSNRGPVSAVRNREKDRLRVNAISRPYGLQPHTTRCTKQVEERVMNHTPRLQARLL